jgi:hypothetical protein
MQRKAFTSRPAFVVGMIYELTLVGLRPQYSAWVSHVSEFQYRVVSASVKQSG